METVGLKAHPLRDFSKRASKRFSKRYIKG
jgi:hypothetical protein